MFHCLVLSAIRFSGSLMPCIDLINHSAVSAFEPSLLSNLVLVSAKSHQKHFTQQGFYIADYFVWSLVSFTIHLKPTSFTQVIANFFIETPDNILSNALWMKFYLQTEVVTSNNNVRGHSGIKLLFFPSRITYHLKLLSHGLHSYFPVFNWLQYNPFYYFACMAGLLPAAYFLFPAIVS